MPNLIALGLLLSGWTAWAVTQDASLGLMFIATLIALNGQPWRKDAPETSTDRKDP